MSIEYKEVTHADMINRYIEEGKSVHAYYDLMKFEESMDLPSGLRLTGNLDDE